MKPELGWVLFSRDALAIAERQLSDQTMGVRDELGFLLLHTGYADHFFPGTSVLLTRMRYILFILWMYDDLNGKRNVGDVSKWVSDFEIRLAGYLRQEEGTIGKRSYPKPTKQPPTYAYWSALSTWGFLKPRPNGRSLSRRELHQFMATKQKTKGYALQDDDHNPLDDPGRLWVQPPSPPDAWHEQELNFMMPENERDFVRQHLISIQKRSYSSGKAFLARLAEQVDTLELGDTDTMWAPQLFSLADTEDKERMNRARQAAALAHIGRSLYPAILEQMKEDECGTDDIRHRNHLEAILPFAKEEALALDLNLLKCDIPSLPSYFANMLFEIQNWIKAPKDLSDIQDALTAVEVHRKGNRARLPNRLSASEHRLAWQSKEHALGLPLEYRWKTVHRLLLDLQGVK